jgi:hypothetical protein
MIRGVLYCGFGDMARRSLTISVKTSTSSEKQGKTFENAALMKSDNVSNLTITAPSPLSAPAGPEAQDRDQEDG